MLVKFSNDKKAIENQPTPSITISPTPTPVETIIGKTWVWEKTVMNDDSVILPKVAAKFTLNFSEEGNLNGKTDCNSFFGKYEIGSDGFIKIGPLAMTKMFCNGSQEEQFEDPISRVKNYSWDTAGKGKLLLYFNEGLVILDRVN